MVEEKEQPKEKEAEATAAALEGEEGVKTERLSKPKGPKKRSKVIKEDVKEAKSKNPTKNKKQTAKKASPKAVPKEEPSEGAKPSSEREEKVEAKKGDDAKAPKEHSSDNESDPNKQPPSSQEPSSSMQPPSMIEPPSSIQPPSMMEPPSSIQPPSTVDPLSSEQHPSVMPNTDDDKKAEPSAVEIKVPPKLKLVKSKPTVSISKDTKKKPEEKKAGAVDKKDKKKKKSKEREKWKAGEMIRSEKFTWKIHSVLGSGGFGDVYKVTKANNSDTKEYAMKTEMVKGNKHMLRLKVEVMVLTDCQKVPDMERKKHFVEMLDLGRNSKFKFVVMGLVGPSLDDIRRKMLCQNYTRPTAMKLSQQTFQSLWDLHLVGWLHRDIKPQNFAIGLGSLNRTVFMLDFGIARRIYKKGSDQVKIPRAKVTFLGTLRFAARACHQQMEQGRKDDLETWLYMVYDLFDEDHGLPWKRCHDRHAFEGYKQKFFKHEFPRAYNIVPKDFRNILTYVDSLGYADQPDYKYIQLTMDEIIKSSNIAVDKNLDWVDLKMAEKSTAAVASEGGKQEGTDNNDD